MSTDATEEKPDKLGLLGSSTFDWLVERFGSYLSELLMDLLVRKSQQGVVAQAASFDVRTILVMLLEKLGPTLLEKAAVALEAREELLAKLAGSVLRQHGPLILAKIVDWLSSSEAVEAINKLLADSK